MRILTLSIAAIALGSCGGGGGSGGGGNSGGGGSTPPPAPTPTSTPASFAIQVEEGQQSTFQIQTVYDGAAGAQIYPEFAVNGSAFAIVGAPQIRGNTISATFRTRPFMPGGTTQNTVDFRICGTSDCSTVIANSAKSYNVQVAVKLDDWVNFQRNNHNDGYVAVAYDTSDFAHAWTWQDSYDEGRILPAASKDNKVYIVVVGYNVRYQGSARVIALDSDTGAPDWTYNLSNQRYASGPSLSDGLLHVTSMEGSSAANPQWVLDAQTGTLVNKMSFATQWSQFSQPAAVDGMVYVAGGYYGGWLYAFDAVAGNLKWFKQPLNANIGSGQSIAIDDNYLYYYAGISLMRFDRSSGAAAGSIPDMESMRTMMDYESGPLLDGRGNVYFFSQDTRFGGRNQIVGASLDNMTVTWRTASSEYTTSFAHRDGIIYAGDQENRRLVALDARDGSILWTTDLPTAYPEVGRNDAIYGNVIATEKHIFVSSTRQTWAIDLVGSDHEIVWEADSGGNLIITPDNYLITSGSREKPNLTAYKLAP